MLKVPKKFVIDGEHEVFAFDAAMMDWVLKKAGHEVHTEPEGGWVVMVSGRPAAVSPTKDGAETVLRALRSAGLQGSSSVVPMAE